MKILNLNKLCSFCSATVITFAISVTSMQSVAETLRLSTPVPPSHIFSKVSTKFAEDLSARTNGDLNIKVFPFGKLGSDPENTLMIQTGAIQLAVIPAAFIANREESLNAWLLPGLFDDIEAAGAATQLPAARDMLTELDKQGMIGLGYVFAGMRHLLSVDPISDMKEIKDKKIRTFPGPIFNDWWLTFGAAPTALPTPEIAPALTTNLLDIVDVDLDLVTALKLYQQAPNLAITNHMAFPAIMVVSRKWWESKTAEQQTVIREVFAEAEAWGIKAQVMAEEKNLKMLKDAGVAIIKIEKSSYADSTAEILNKYINKTPLISEFYEQVKAEK